MTVQVDKVIFKYKVMSADGSQPGRVSVPNYSKVVFVGVQHGEVFVWLSHYEGYSTKEVVFRVVGTGHKFSKYLTHLGSVQDGPYVWHVLTDDKELKS